MLTLINIIYSALCMAIPCMFYFVYLMRQKKEKRSPMFHFFETAVFLIYIYMVFSVTGIGSIWEIGKYDSVIRLDEINLIPFQAGKMITNILNLIMFVPLGFLIPLIWQEYRNVGKVLITGASFSLSIELAQLSNRRVTDIDDLLMNTIGTLVGYIIWYGTKKVFSKWNKKAASMSKNEPVIYLLLSIAGEFLLYNWRLLFRFL